MRRLLVVLSALPRVRVWRQNVGKVERAGGGFFSSGLPKGAADIGGIVDVGRPGAPVGVVLQVETKGEGGETTPEQEAFATMIRSLGGIYLRPNAKDGIEAAAAQVMLAIEARRR